MEDTTCRALADPAHDEVTNWRDFDAVIVACCAEEGTASCRAAASLVREGVPLILLSGKAGDCRCRKVCWQSLEAVDMDEAALATTLESCLQRLTQLPSGASELCGFHNYAQFLNHEIRTPLTAAQSAMQILARELHGQTDDRLLPLVRIALRNLQRLSRTVAWSEDYLSSRVQQSTPDWQPGSVADLLDRVLAEETLAGQVELQYRETVGELSIVSDEHLLGTACQQVLRTFCYNTPTTKVQIEVSIDRAAVLNDMSAPDVAAAELVLSYRCGSGKAVGWGSRAVSRTGLVSQGELPEEELTWLLEFTVSREILGILGARVRITADPDNGEPVVELILPLSPGAAEAWVMNPVLPVGGT
ncbi:MAG: histidine kinase dimerization/phospho-acceptor domain-containing protein [bacterium]